MSYIKYIVLMLYIVAIAMIAFKAEKYEAKYNSQRTIIEKLSEDNQKLKSENLQLRNDIVAVKKIDKDITENLANAENQINVLRDRLLNDYSVYVNATCPDVPATTPTPTKPYAASARLNDTVKQDFLDLKERAMKSEIMIKGLQRYIKAVCLRENTTIQH